jgi:uncharacterized protein (DUF1330 family)
MTKLLPLMTGMAIGAMLPTGIVMVNAQAPAPTPQTTRNAVFMITEQTITDPKGYAEEYAPKVIPIIKAHGGRYVARTDQITNLAGEAGPKRIVILGFESIDEIKKMQATKEYTDLQPIRDRVYKVRQYAIATCKNPQGAKPGQTDCP